MKNNIARHGFLVLAGLFLLTSGLTASASELVYQPINPAFGGNPLNGPQLLNEANAQNEFKAPAPDPLKTFTDTLNRALLNRLSSQIIGMAFGDTGIQPGHYQMGNYSVDIALDADGLGFTVKIVDVTNSNQTTIQVPYQ